MLFLIMHGNDGSPNPLTIQKYFATTYHCIVDHDFLLFLLVVALGKIPPLPPVIGRFTERFRWIHKIQNSLVHIYLINFILINFSKYKQLFISIKTHHSQNATKAPHLHRLKSNTPNLLFAQGCQMKISKNSQVAYGK